ncbi:MAG: diguanylate cyclase [Casimicrobiaceae bacterium]
MNPPRDLRFSPPRHRHLPWALPVFGLLLVGAMWIGTWVQMRSTERVLLEAATRDIAGVATSFEHYTRRTIKDADRIALLIKHEFEQQGTLDFPRLIRAGLIEAGGVLVVNVADATGDIIARSRADGPFNIGDREIFLLHAAQDTGLLDISKPVVSRVSGRPTILMSRRLNHADGTFAGIVVLSVTPDYFMEFYREADLGTRGSLGLYGRGGTFRARSVGDEATSVSDGGEAQLATHAAASPVGYYDTRGTLDGIARIVAYRTLPDYPLIVTAAVSVDAALADFYEGRDQYLIVRGIASAVILAFFAALTIQAMRLRRHRDELKAQRRFLETIVDNIPSGIAVRSMAPATYGQYVLWNESNALTFGLKSEDALGKTMRDVMPARNTEEVAELDRQLLASPMVQDVVQLRELPGKGPRIIRLIRAPIFGAQGEVAYIMTSATDITEARARTDALELASKVFETTADAIIVSDADDRVIRVNAAFSKLTGYAAKDVVGTILAESPFRPIDVVESKARMDRQLRDGFVASEVSRFRKDGTPLSLWVTASFVLNDDGSIRNYVRVFTDISLLKDAQQKLEQLANVDALTGLPNRRLLLDRMEQAAHRAQRNNTGMAVMFIDLDDFKQVNDSLGHDVGDLLLREAAIRMQSCIRLSDSIGRIGGDEFAIVVEEAHGPADAAQVCARIVAALAAPFVLAGHRITTAASVGIAVYPDDGSDAATLLRNADMAMYRAKDAGRNRCAFFTKGMDAMATAD